MSDKPATSRPLTAQWLVWTVLILIGGMFFLALIVSVVTSLAHGMDARLVPFLVLIVLFVAVFICLKALFKPTRGRTDEMDRWRQQFPAHKQEEIHRFLQSVGKSLDLREKDQNRLRPDDRVSALSQELFCGDGMDIVELVLAVEAEYGLALPECFLETCQTLGELFDYVTRQCRVRSGSVATGTHNNPESG